MAEKIITRDLIKDYSALSCIFEGRGDSSTVVTFMRQKIKCIIDEQEVLEDKEIMDLILSLISRELVNKEDYHHSITNEPMSQYSITPKGIEFLDEIYEPIRNRSAKKIKEGAKVTVNVVEEIFGSYEIVIAPIRETFAMENAIQKIDRTHEPIKMIELVFSKNEPDRSKRIALNFPALNQASKLDPLKSPNYDYNIVNAFATFMTVQGIQVFFPVPSELKATEIVYELKEYDANNPPDHFVTLDGGQFDKILGIKPKDRRYG